MENSEDLREKFRKFPELTIGRKVDDPHIKGLKVRDMQSSGGVTIIQEGGMLPASLRPDTAGEKILAIFLAADLFLVVTANRGGLRGMPYLFGKEEAVDIIS